MINKFIIKHLLIILIILYLVSCVLDRADSKLELQNNSKSDIYYFVQADTTFKSSLSDYFDENSWTGRILLIGQKAYPLFAFKNHGGYINKINKEGLDSSLYLYVFEADSVKKYGWNTIADKRMYFRSKYNVKQLDSINWFIHLNEIVNIRRKPF